MCERRVKIEELAAMCQVLNTLTNRQFRPQLQLVKLHTILIKISSVAQYFESEEEIVKYFEMFHFEYKQNHPYILTTLVGIIRSPQESQKEKMSNFAKKLDEWSQWEWESRRKSKSRRKAHYGRNAVPTKRETMPMGMHSSASTNTLSSLSSASSDEYEDSGSYADDYDPKFRAMNNLAVHMDDCKDSYRKQVRDYEWEREQYESEMYLQQCRQRMELERGYYPVGKSFVQTRRHMNYNEMAYDYYDYDLDYESYSDFSSGLNLSKPDTQSFDFFSDERNLSPYIY